MSAVRSLLPRATRAPMRSTRRTQRCTLHIMDAASGRTVDACRLANGRTYAVWLTPLTGSRRPQYVTMAREQMRVLLRNGARIEARR
jgi:hypothetical protein